ncbi:TetR/AcrR family transcriptional regulator [Nonomuraea angiospora]|uniref:AcrR family transcriptional regulator n=1 Tax=Nonomuraea angiospora TaxID=46172 RepID=A0ABR9MCH8_9ACTN|nr:TetR/AcrR family transcriptional regulator [Nonomuraea angiospora]MBE1590619.1 AcrR family transcriptional regulator [Nonomuraea angiospora]
MNQPKRRDKAATRAKLLDAARLRFARQGYDGTGVREIAADVGVDPALVFRYFGSKERLHEEAVRVEIPAGLTDDPARPLPHITDTLLHDVVFADWEQFAGEHPLLVMLRSAGHPAIRDQLRTQICEGYLPDFAARMGGENPALRAEMVGALLLGMGVMRSILGSPALSEASFEETRVLVARLVTALSDQPPR